MTDMKLPEAQERIATAWKRASDAVAYHEAADGRADDTGPLFKALCEVCEALRPGVPFGMATAAFTILEDGTEGS